MIQIDARSGFWTIKHLTCGAIFQITGEKLLDATQPIKCSNCGIQINLSYLKDAAMYLAHCQENIDKSSERHNDPSTQVWQIDPPIKLVEDVKPPKLVQVLK